MCMAMHSRRPSTLFRWTFVLLVWLSSSSGAVRADHYAGATITYTCLGSNFYTVYLDLYLNCSGVPITAQKIRFQNECGVFFQQANLPLLFSEEVSPTCASQLANTTCQPGGTLPGFKRYRFSTTVYLSPCNFWTMRWNICCRNTTENLLNTPGTYAAATLNNSGGVCDNSPRFADNGVPFLCVNAPVSYNPGVSDPNGNTMLFSLISAQFDSVNSVVYRAGFSGTVPIPGLIFNSTTGQLNFVPTVSGNYVVVIQVTTYNSSNQEIGHVMRDLMFVVRPCDGSPPIPSPITNVTGVAASGTSSVAVCNGQSFCADMVVTDANAVSVITMTSNVTALLPGATFQVLGTNPATARICWTANLAMLPANIFIDISDGACPIENTASRSLFIGSCLLLPIELVGFETSVEGAGVLLKWSTASEIDNDHFTVERSSDAVLFDGIGRVAAIGQSNTLQHYSFKDMAPGRGINYYRLRQTDTDGTTTFSSVISVEIGADLPLYALFDGVESWEIRGALVQPTWLLTDGFGRKVEAAAFEPTDGGYRLYLGGRSSETLLLTVWHQDAHHTIRLPAFPQAGDMVAARSDQ